MLGKVNDAVKTKKWQGRTKNTWIFVQKMPEMPKTVSVK
jgi:hypothetical protein